MIGAHPDDCEWKTGGLATKYRNLGHVVKYVSVTNGNAGHHTMDPTSLAERRRAEAFRVSKETGIEYEVFDIPDGRLEPNLVNRERVITLIRDFHPDLIFTHRTVDYHPDHRNTGQLVMDASYLIRVPIICPRVPPVRKNPVILYMYDGFQKPIPLKPDVAVAIDGCMESKARMQHCHASQFYEWLPWVSDYEGQIPVGDAERLEWTLKSTIERDTSLANKYRKQIEDRYGETEGKSIVCAEFFEVSEYGRPLQANEVDELFPR